MATIGTTNVDIAEVKSVIGNNSNDVATLCKSTTINEFAKYRPGYLDINSQYLLFQAPRGNGTSDPRGLDTELGLSTEVFKLGDFRG